MPGPIASKLRRRALTPRSGIQFGLAAAALLLGCQSLQNAVANGDTRTITMHHVHTGERITVTFKENGRYDDAALRKLNWFLRDWRENRDTRMDPHLIDLVWEAYREVEGSQPIEIICGYRDESTNAMLRRRSTGVAQHSLHMRGQAMDFAIPGVPLDRLRAAGLRLQRGGVGFYPSSGSPFVHMDVGGIRHWPRMTREQLVRVFPDGRTVHVPSDGKPLAGYALALADVGRRGNSPSSMSLTAANDAGIDTETTASADTPRRSLWAGLFGGFKDDAANEAKPRTAPAAALIAAAPAIPARSIPLPKMRPAAAPTVVAMALPAPATDSPKAAAIVATRSLAVASAAPSATDIIRTRGYWVGVADIGRPAGRTETDTLVTGALPVALRAPASDLSKEALAYAPQPERHPSVRTPPRSVVMPSAKTATTVAMKAAGEPMAAPMPAYDPWLDAVILTPSVQTYLSSTQYGSRDFRSLRPLLDKPAMSVAMAFSDDPHDGLRTEHFGGRAIVFLRTLTFVAAAEVPARTASLR